jgi:hypothetical protein
MTVLEIENTAGATTEHWSVMRTESDQSNPVTRRVTLDAFLGELETGEIERNSEFYATILARLSKPVSVVKADEVLGEL